MLGVGDGTVQKSLGEFLQTLRSIVSSIFTRFRDIAAFVLQHATFSHSTSSPTAAPQVRKSAGPQVRILPPAFQE